MAAILIAGNELGDAIGEGWFFHQSDTPTPAVNQIGGRKTPQLNGGKYYYYTVDNGAGGTTRRLARPLGFAAPYTELYGRLCFNSSSSIATRDLCEFWLGDPRTTGVRVAALRAINQGSGQWLNWVNGAGSVIGQTLSFWNFNNFTHRIEWHLKLGASGAICEIWVDDVLSLSLSSQNITGAGGQATMDWFTIGNIVPNGGIISAFDDIAINDLTDTVNNARVGEGVVVLLSPARPGLFTQLTNSFNAVGPNNMDHVNKLPQDGLGLSNLSLFVGTNVDGTKDTFKTTSAPPEFGGVRALAVVANCVRNGTALQNVKLLLEPGWPAQTVAPGVSLGAGSGAHGGVDAGVHQWLITNIGFPVGGESLPGPVTGFTVVGGTQVATVTAPAGPAGTTSRQVYRNTIATPLVFNLVGTIPDNNPATPFTDDYSDANLGTGVPVSEIASSNIPLPNGGFGWVQNIFNVNPNTGQPFTYAELEAIEVGLQFKT